MHTHGWFESLYTLIACYKIKIIKITTYHAFDKSWRDIIHIKLLKNFDKVICVSKYLKLELFNRGIEWSKMEVIHNCYNKSFNKTLVTFL